MTTAYLDDKGQRVYCTLPGLVLEMYRTFGQRGMTDEEVAFLTSYPRSSIRRARQFLVEQGDLVLLDIERQTESGRWARVYCTPEKAKTTFGPDLEPLLSAVPLGSA